MIDYKVFRLDDSPGQTWHLEQDGDPYFITLFNQKKDEQIWRVTRQVDMKSEYRSHTVTLKRGRFNCTCEGAKRGKCRHQDMVRNIKNVQC